MSRMMPVVLLLGSGLAVGMTAAEHRVWLEPAPHYRFPADPDSNSPAFWDGDELNLFTSNQKPSVSRGPDLERLGGAEPTRFVDGTDKLRWIEAVYRREDRVLFGLYHREEYRGECPEREYFTVPEIGVARSFDAGRTWTDLGTILQDLDVERSCATANEYFAGGVGDPSWAVTATDGFAYIFFSSYTEPVTNQGIQMARVALDDLEMPVGKVWRWHAGKWDAPGIGGRGTPVVPAERSWSLPDANAFWGPSVHWNVYLETHVILANRARDAKWTQEGVYVFFAPQLNDPTTFTRPKKIHDGGSWYAQVMGDRGIRGTDSRAGRTARFFMHGKSDYRIAFEKVERP